MSKTRQYQLRRTVRLIIDPAADASATSNGFGGTPAPMGLPRFYELDVRCSGIPDERTGYLVDIKAIDRAVRGRAADVIRSACANEPDADPIRVLRAVAGSLTEELGPPFAGVRWNLTPYHAVEMSMAMSMENALDQQHSGESHTALLRERFDFAAAHRLHVPTLSDDENRAIFGKCNNPSGHGHNYQIEPCVELDTAALADAPFGFAELERATHEQVITPFDHKHLNTDTPEFGEAGVNPSVENMARVFFERLAPAIRRSSAAATLRSITVWETDRTSCTYPA